MSRHNHYYYEHDTETGCLTIYYSKHPEMFESGDQLKETFSFSVKPSNDGYRLLVYRSEKEEVTQQKRDKWKEFRTLFQDDVKRYYNRERFKYLFS